MVSSWCDSKVFDATSVNLKQNHKGSRPTCAHVSLLNSSKLRAKTGALTGVRATVKKKKKEADANRGKIAATLAKGPGFEGAVCLGDAVSTANDKPHSHISPPYRRTTWCRRQIDFAPHTAKLHLQVFIGPAVENEVQNNSSPALGNAPNTRLNINDWLSKDLFHIQPGNLRWSDCKAHWYEAKRSALTTLKPP